MLAGDVREAKHLTVKIGGMLEQIIQLSDGEPNVAAALTTTCQQIEELEAALWYVEPQAVDEPIADTLREYYL